MTDIIRMCSKLIAISATVEIVMALTIGKTVPHRIAIPTFSASSSLQMSGNYNDRMARYGYFPHDDEEESQLLWDYEDDNSNFQTDDMFAGYQNQSPPQQQNQEQQLQQQHLQHQENESGEDELPTMDIEGAEITEDFKAKIRANNQDEKEEASQGGEKFRKMMARAQDSAASSFPRLQTNSYAYQHQSQSQVYIPPNSMSLSVDEQARLFRELMMERQNHYHYQQQQQQQQTTYEHSQTNFYPQNPPNQYEEQTKHSHLNYNTNQFQGNCEDSQSMQALSEIRQQDPYEQALQKYQEQQKSQQFEKQERNIQTGPDPYLQSMNQYQQQTHPMESIPQGMQQNQQYQQMSPSGMTPQKGPTYSYREYGTGYDGRKIGRNKDADTISNAADVYFAQLKRDSTSRNLARYSGDERTANAVFHDPSIHDITVPVNPYREEQRARERELLETDPEEMLIFQEYGEEEQHIPSNTPSYKERLAQFRQNRLDNRN